MMMHSDVCIDDDDDDERGIGLGRNLDCEILYRWCWVEILDSGFLVVMPGEDVGFNPDNLIETYFSEEYIVKSESTVDDATQ